jgi:hypothetical protein
MKKQNIKIAIFTTLVLAMVYYIGWTFYVSEPEYINNCNKAPEPYDYVSIPYNEFSFSRDAEVINGIVLQVDENKFLVKCYDYRDSFYELDKKDSKYRIIGKGTIYHKVNYYVGFNIMMLAQVVFTVLSALLIITLVTILLDFLK